jgi:hypothetical protein
MRLDVRRWLTVIFGIIAVAWLSACTRSNNVTGPASTPTPTPTPLSLSGHWVGSFASDAGLVVCYSTGAGSASADLNENGSGVSGELSWHVNICNEDVIIQATRTGNALAGTATLNGVADILTGTIESTDLTLVVAPPPDGHGFTPGGTATLHRP